jgi:hypothetical protein
VTWVTGYGLLSRFGPYVVALVLAVVLVAVTVSRGGASKAAEAALGDEQLRIMAPADSGGGCGGRW